MKLFNWVKGYIIFFVLEFLFIPLILISVNKTALGSLADIEIGIMIICILVILLVVRPKFDFSIFQKGNRKKTFLNVIKMAVLCFVLSFLAGVIISQFTNEIPVNQQIIENELTQSLGVLLFITVVLAPILEELTYRYLLIHTHPTKLKWIFLVISSLLFGYAHIALNPSTDYIFLPIYAGIGLLFGLYYLKSNNILLPILTHATYNLMALLMSLLA